MSFIEKRRAQLDRSIQSSSRGQILLVGGILLVAATRLWLIRDAIFNPSSRLFVDSEQYLNLARSLLENGRYEDPTGQMIDLFRSPGYPFFLAICLAIGGNSLTAVTIAQAALELASVFLIYLTGKELGAKKAGVFGALIMLASPNSLFFSMRVMSEVVFAFGLILVFLLTLKMMRGKFPSWGIGIALALLAYVRPIGLYLILIWGVMVYFGYRRWGDKVRAVTALAQICIAGILVLTPWYVRNLIAYREPVFATVSRSTVQTYHLALTLVDAKGIDWDQAKNEVFELGGGPSSISRIARQHPISFAKVQIRGIARTIVGLEASTWVGLITGKYTEGYGFLDALVQMKLGEIPNIIRNAVDQGGLGSFVLTIWGLLHTLLLYGFSVLAVYRARSFEDRRAQFALVLAVVTIGYMVLVPGAAGEARFRVPVEPLLAFVAGLVWFPVKKRGGDRWSDG